MTVLEVRHLGKSYPDYGSELVRIGRWFGLPLKPKSEHWVLQDVSFKVGKGESLGIVGKNGAGKSTLLKMVTGVLHPSEGSIEVQGKIAAILELGMGFNPALTARQNVHHALGLMGYSQELIEKVMPETEAFAEIGEYFDEPLRTYSSGMQMRVAFAVATAFRPDILIVDEALAVGDAYFQAKCFERISNYKSQGMSLILVTHSTSDIVKHCDRAIMLQDGKLVLAGHPKDISNAYLSSLHLPEKAEEAPGKDKFVLMAHEDNFHTRPGYRKEEHRWGEGGAHITDYLIRTERGDFPEVIYANEKVDFYFSVVFDQDYDNVTPGFLLKSIDGVFLYGTNGNKITGKEFPVKKGQVVSFYFSMPMNLNTGHYLVSFGISHGPQEALIPLDRRYDSVLLSLNHENGIWGIVDLNAAFDKKVVNE